MIVINELQKDIIENKENIENSIKSVNIKDNKYVLLKREAKWF